MSLVPSVPVSPQIKNHPLGEGEGENCGSSGNEGTFGNGGISICIIGKDWDLREGKKCQDYKE
jgi:hypothetical protein